MPMIMNQHGARLPAKFLALGYHRHVAAWVRLFRGEGRVRERAARAVRAGAVRAGAVRCGRPW